MRLVIKRLAIIGAVLFSLLLLAIGVGGPAQTNSATQTNTVQVLTTSKLSRTKSIPIAINSGNRFTITLPSNQTTGYQWRIGKQPSGRVVKFLSSTYNAPSTKLVGQGGTETWTFTVVGVGNTTITMQYIRPWEKNVPPAQSQNFAVSVK
ncbi:MAG: protease inhibitor I42 family protein [Armatimonadota bacterium]|nr:protease inhibitor I42 family protein [bacterium]